jgi:hypothetical protein
MLTIALMKTIRICSMISLIKYLQTNIENSFEKIVLANLIREGICFKQSKSIKMMG